MNSRATIIYRLWFPVWFLADFGPSPDEGRNPVVGSSSQSTDNAVNRSQQSEPEGRILPFRPRGSNPARNAPPPPPVPDLGKYERRPDEPDDYRHRMMMNGLGLAATAVLIVVGLWIADVMAHMRKDQDCVLAGRPGCTRVDAPVQAR